MWKMRLLALCIVLATCALRTACAANANNGGHANAAVGLYAPDRYDGIPDMCLMPMDFGYCRAKVKRYYFDMRRMKCNMFYWGGCAGNVNNFKSMEECNKVCLDAYEDSEDTGPGASASVSPNTNRNYENTRGYVKSAPPSSAPKSGGYGNLANYKNFKVNRNYGSTEQQEQSSAEEYEN